MRNTLKINRLRILTLLFLGQNFLLSGQSSLDSLRAVTAVDSLLNLSKQLSQSQKNDEAMQAIEAAKIESEAVFGKTHPIYVKILTKQGYLLYGQSKFLETATVFKEKLSLIEHGQGKKTIAYFLGLGDLCTVYQNLGEFSAAEQGYIECISMAENLPGIKKTTFAGLLMNLANLYSKTSQFEKAETHFLHSKTILEEIGQTETPTYIYGINGLGSVYSRMKQYDQAIEFLTIASQFYIKNKQQNTADYAFVLHELGLVYYYLLDYEKAETLLLESKSIYQDLFGTQNTSYAGSLSALGSVYLEMNLLEKATAFYGEAKILYETPGINCEQCYTATLTQIGRMKLLAKQYPAAIEQLEFVLDYIKKKRGIENDDYLTSAAYLFKTYFPAGKTEQAVSQFFECVALEKRLLSRASAHFSQTEIARYLPRISKTENWFGTLARNQKSLPENWNEAFYDAVLFQKGYFLQSSQLTSQQVATAPDSTQQFFGDWKNCQKQLAKIYGQSKNKVDSLENLSIFLEKKLVQNLSGFSESRREVRWQEVQSSLKNGEAAIEFVHFTDLFSDSKNTFYAALVILPGSETPKFVPLFEEKELLKLTNRSTSWLQDYVEKTYAFRQTGDVKNLFQLVFQPLEKLLNSPSEVGGQTKTIYFSPSGLLHRLNLEAIQTENGKTLADRFQFVPLGSTRQLVVPPYFTTFENQTATIFGGIKFDSDSTSFFQENQNLTASRNAANSRGFDFSQADSTLRGNVWKYLPATEIEAQNIENHLKRAGFQTEKMTGFAASEENLKLASSQNLSPKILHIATHGFFFPDPKNRDEARGVKNDEPIFKVSENPMIRSGLVLAGANQAWKTGKSIRPDMEDGILTALEISQLNLSNTELVVLSACETGLGDIAGNEGVFGLQRAFKIAGAKYLVMSLWKVDDKKTSEMMTLFYEKWLAEKLPLPVAFRAAQKTMREKYPNPFFWAGFVLVE